MSNIIQNTTQVKERSGIVVATGTLLSSYEYRIGLVIQNLNTDPLFVKFGEGASTSDFDFILKGGSTTDDGTGGIMSFDVLSYTGIITVDGATVRCIATGL